MKRKQKAPAQMQANNYAADNALLQICRRVNQQCESVDRRDIKTLSEIFHREYESVKQVLPGVSYFKFTYQLGVLNKQFKER